MKKSVKVNGFLNIVQKSCHILIPLLIFPYLTRVLGAENFGKFSFANSIISYVILAAMLGVNSYAIREGARIRDDKKALSSFVSEVFSINIFSGLLAILFLICAVSFNSKLGEYDTLIYIMSLIVPATVLGRDYLNVIYEDFLYITLRYIIIQIIGVFMVFILVRESTHYIIYTGIYTFTMTAGYIINLFYTKKYAPIHLTFKLNLKKHLNPILILFCGQLATTIYIQSNITMIGIFKTDYEVGIYSFASKIYILSKSMINALTAVAIPRIVYYLGANNLEKYNSFSSRLFDYLLSLTTPISVGLFIFGDEIVRLIGGPEYITGVSSLKILSIALLVAVFSGYFCNAILVPNRQEKQFLYITILSAILNIALNFVFIPKIGIFGAALSTLFSEILVVALAFGVSKKNLRLSIAKKNFILTIFGSALVLIICLVSKNYVESYLIRLIITTPITVIIYAMLHLLFKNNLYFGSAHSLINKIMKK